MHAIHFPFISKDIHYVEFFSVVSSALESIKSKNDPSAIPSFAGNIGRTSIWHGLKYFGYDYYTIPSSPKFIVANMCMCVCVCVHIVLSKKSPIKSVQKDTKNKIKSNKTILEFYIHNSIIKLVNKLLITFQVNYY